MHLFHEQEDVSLSSFKHITVWMLQAFHRQTHCPAINVDPARGAGSQEGPEHKHTQDQYYTSWLMHSFPNLFHTIRYVVLCHFLPNIFSISNCVLFLQYSLGFEWV